MIRRWRGFFTTLRFRLVGWYVVLLVLTLALFSLYFFFQFRALQQVQQDTTLQSYADRLRGLVGPPGGVRPDDGGFGGSGSGPLAFRSDLSHDPTANELIRRNIQVLLFNEAASEVGNLGSSASDVPTVTNLSAINIPTFTTLTSSDSTQWRMLVVPMPFQSGWVVLAQPLVVVDTALGNLFAPIVLGTVLALVAAVLGGLFLANRALNPIDRVTRTAQSITAQDLSKRMNYYGPMDEVGRLAKTLDQMLDRLEQGFEQERRFTSDASHELRTPLTALKGRLEVTLSRPRTVEEYQDTLTDLGEEVERLVRLSSSLLYLARLDQTKQFWQSERLNLSDLLDSIVDSLEPVAELKEIKLTSAITPNLEISGNLDQLTRLFLNLIDNAIKYTPEGGQVTVHTQEDSEKKQVEISISDTGQGIAPEHLPHIFQRFYRAQSDRASNTGGAGLGLAIASEIARGHGGQLEAESQVGHGTTMRVILPL